MVDPVLLVDLDGTLTRTELLPVIARHVGLEEEMTRLTAATMAGEIPFDVSFRERVAMLADVPIAAVQDAILSAPVFDELLGLLREQPERALVVTGNLDVWVQPFFDRHGLAGISSRATVADGKVAGIASILSKDVALAHFGSRPRIAVGDGANDAAMIRGAEIGIAWCGVHAAAEPVLEVADYAFAREETLCRFLRRWW